MDSRMHAIIDNLAGHLSPTARVLTALAPALFIAAWFLVGFAVFAVRTARHGMPVDPETVRRGDSLLTGSYLRHYFFWLIHPLDRALLRSGISANRITLLAALLGLASGAAVAAGRFALGGWLFIASGVLDTLDGRVARARGEVSAAGGALDSVLDRYVDAFVLMGLGWYYRDSWILLLVLLAMLGTSLVPYVRAKSESLGMPQRDGLMQRADRVVYLGVSVAMSPILEVALNPAETHPRHWLAVGGLGMLAVLSNVTAVQRLVGLLRALAPEAPVPRLGPLWRPDVRRHAAAVLGAMVAGFAFVVFLVEAAELDPGIATLCGGVGGGAARLGWDRFVGVGRPAALATQTGRNTLIYGAAALLNAGGVALLTLHPQIDYRLAWWLVLAVVSLAWTLPMRRAAAGGLALGAHDAEAA